MATKLPEVELLHPHGYILTYGGRSNVAELFELTALLSGSSTTATGTGVTSDQRTNVVSLFDVLSHMI